MANNQTFTLNIKALFDASDVRAKVNDIQNAFKGLKLSDSLKNNLQNSFSGLEKALNDFEKRTQQGIRSKSDAKGLNTSIDKVISEYLKLDKIVNQVKNNINSSTDLSKIIKLDDSTISKIEKIKKDIAGLQKEINKINGQALTNLQQKLDQLHGKKSTEYGNQIFDLFKAGDAEKAINLIDEVIKRYEKLPGAMQKGTQFYELINTFKEMRKVMTDASDAVAPKMEQIGQKAQQAGNLTKSSMESAVSRLNQASDSARQYGNNLQKAGERVKGMVNDQARLNTELDQIKYRVQYFLGLTNAVNLFKRSIRSAFNTVKELDKAMTETAVVTNKTISDMWKQLPEYTTRANSLGVTTLEAYKAATLYYQQGLNDVQVNDLSVETLKMARIAGLEAAEATDRMTNALRGFNMELNAVNAQRVDDVYSKLAAMSASNVDEISTAMTKVASLAHNANMDFETTAAFLAQIIETTRESAETAGTALKTVAARFTEVKKLVSENQLQGSDEEGQTIDVNKVSAALRTAGIDLNKYFLGEVGLDDIFMELASKWDNLTSIQQRYIATQAAGSRQQSRFIAMMQDYARTQELVSAAYSAEGASAEQFAKTQDSLQSKLARLKNAWDEFTMGIANSTAIKLVVDGLTLLLNVVNKIASAFGPAIGGTVKLTVALTTLAGLRKLFISNGGFTKLLEGFGNSPVGRFLGLGNGKKGQEVSDITEVKAAALQAVEEVKTTAIAAEQEESATATVAEQEESATATVAEQEESVIATVAEQEESATAAVAEQEESVIAAAAEQEESVIAAAAEQEESVIAAAAEQEESIAVIGAAGASFKAQVDAAGVDFAAAVHTAGAGAGAAGAGAAGAGAGAAAGAAGAGAAGGTAGAGAGAAVLGGLSVAALVAAIIGIVVGSIALQDYLKSGAREIKLAEKAAETQRRAADTQKDAAKLQKESYEKYLKNEKILRTSTDSKERAQAEIEMREALLDLKSIDSNNVIERNGIEIIDNVYAKNRAEFLEEQVDITEASINFSDAATAMAQAEKERRSKRTSGITNDQGAFVLGSGNVGGSYWSDIKYFLQEGQDYNFDTNKYNEARDIEISRYENRSRQEIAEGVKNLLDDYDEEIANSTAQFYSKIYDASAYNKRVQEISGVGIVGGRDVLFNKADFINEYEAIHGTGSAKDMSVNELSTALAQEQVTNEQLDKLIKIADLYNTSGGENFLKAFSGKGEIQNINWSLWADKSFDSDELLKELGITTDTLAAFADATGESEEQLRKQIKLQATYASNALIETKAGIYQRAIENGINIDENLFNQIQNLSPEKANIIPRLLDTASELVSPQEFKDLYKSFLEMSQEDFQQFSDFFQNFNLNDPINALHQLKKETKAISTLPVDNPYRKMIEDINEANKSVLNTGNLIQTFVTSDTYEGLTKELQKLIKKNDSITAKNIEELAESCETLENLLSETNVTAQGLATTFTLLEKGEIQFNAITSSILAALSAGENFETMLGRIEEIVKDFDPGTNMAVGTEHIVEVITNAEEYLSDWQFGNKPLINIYDHIFGKDAYKKYMEGEKGVVYIPGAWGTKSYDEIETELTKKMEQVKKWAENEGVGALEFLSSQNASGVTKIGEGEYSWNIKQYQTTADAISDIATQLGVSEDMARMFIEAWGSHFYELGQAWDNLNFNEQINAFVSDLGDNVVITQQELDALAKSTGKDTEEILKAINEVRGATKNPIKVLNWQKNGMPLAGDELKNTFYETAGIEVAGNKNGLGIRSYIKNSGELKELLSGENIDYNELNNKLLNAYKLTPEQAKEVANSIAKDSGKKLSQEISTVEFNPETNTWEQKTKEITGETVEEFEKNLKEAEKAVDAATYAKAIAESGAFTEIGNVIAEALGGGIPATIEIDNDLSGDVQRELNKKEYRITIDPFLRYGGKGNLMVAQASGGIVGSYAKGSENFHVKPGTALTGEEDPEIVWNKKHGYAYITGVNGPEFQDLKPGDRVFNASETKRILHNSAKTGGKVKSLIDGDIKTGNDMLLTPVGPWKPSDSKKVSSANANVSKNTDEILNTLDWLYNLMEDIAELERIQTILSDKHDRYLEDISKTGRDLYKITNDQLNNLYTQRDNYQEAVTRRLQEMREQITENELSNYVWWNGQDNTIEIDWDAINEITDKDQFEKVSDLVSKAEKIQDQIDEAQDALWEIEGQIDELEKRYLQEFIDLQKRVYDAVVNSYQQQIDALSSLNETINESNDKVLNSLQKEIELQRQIRDNTDTEKNIQEMEARLAFLRRDTTGGNAAEIRSLEKQLEEARRDYADTLIDQAIDKLQESNSEASEERQKQIELLTEQLDYWKEIGALWPEVARLLDEGINGEGSLIRGSTLEKILQEAEGWKAMSEQQREVWSNELITAVNQAGAYIIKMSEGFESLSEGIWALIPESSIPAGERKYATGGLVTSTGHAWLDGTKAEPEYVLNARQTDAFLKLAEVLPSMFNGNGSVTNNLGGNVYVELNMSVGEIGSDYDVDRLVERVKEDIYNAGSYRNVNAVSFMR